MSKVFIVNGSGGYKSLFEQLDFTVTDDITSASLVCFTGGEDVTPSFYGHERHPTTGCNTYRDRYEADIFNLCKERGIAMVGICRGAQFLNVMSGGEMYQDVRNHTADHLITDAETGEMVWVSSTHHQMMKPSSKAVIVATAHLAGDRLWFEEGVFKREVSKEDIEVVYYPETNCLCFQPHPEFQGAKYGNMHMYFEGLIEKYLIKTSADNHVGCTC